MCDTYKQREILYRTFKGICFYCDQQITFVNGTRDHFWPRAKRGWNGIHNLVLSCENCNCRKSDRYPTLAEFYKLLEYRPFLTIQDFHEPYRDPSKLSVRGRKALARADEKRAKKKAKHAAKNQAHKDRAEAHRALILHSNMAGPFYAGTCVEGGCVRAHRGPSFPFEGLKFVTVTY